MAVIRPFRGIFYNRGMVGNLSTVVAPPYDVIPPEARGRYSHRNTFNIIRLDLGEDFSGDDETTNRYTRARAFFEEWLDKGVLKQDELPALYLYEIAHQKRFLGFLSLLRVEESGSRTVLPHEETYPRQKEDRLNLLRATGSHFSPIIALYSDEENTVLPPLHERASQIPPLCEAVDDEGITHRIWSVSDQETIRKVSHAMEEKVLLIADGHHRYETALLFHNQTRREGSGYIMALLAPVEGGGVTVLPTHRVLRRLGELSPEELLRTLPRYFSIDFLSVGSARDPLQDRFLREMRRRNEKGPVIGMYVQGTEGYWFLSPTEKGMAEVLIQTGWSPAWGRLSVALFQVLVLDKLLGVRGEEEVGTVYVKSEGEGIEQVRAGAAAAFFFLPPTIQEIWEIALNGEKMPPKTTYFYPKPLTGLLINRMEGYDAGRGGRLR